MARELKVSVGQYSDKGRKATNQDFHGVLIPEEPLLSLKGIAVVLADGISSSSVSQVASESAVKSFLMDYYCTSEAWSVKTSAQRVISATNSWLHSQTRQGEDPYDNDKGYVCTLSAMVIKSRIAHIFHIGDARIYRVDGHALDQLTIDHRIPRSPGHHYLSRALGISPQIEIDYSPVAIEPDDTFLLATDGVYENVSARVMAQAIQDAAGDLTRAARTIVEKAYQAGSADNLTVQIVRIDRLPDGEILETLDHASDLPLPPILDARMMFDGYRIVRELHGSSRSHVYLAVDTASNRTVVIKTPSIDLGGDQNYLKRFAMEEWVARRINSAHVLKPYTASRKRNFLYVVMEFIDGQTLSQWMIDNPRPDLETVRGIVEQIARGLRAFHRLEMLHQDLRPDNLLIDKTGTVKIIDFGSAKVAGVIEAAPSTGDDAILGTVQYTAPEYFLHEAGSSRSDLFSLGVITYQMLTGRLPYGTPMANGRTKAQQRKIRYRSALEQDPSVPGWIDGALRKAVHPDPAKRYAEISEYLYDLRHPNREFLRDAATPLMERNPLLFWKSLSAAFAVVILLLLVRLFG